MLQSFFVGVNGRLRYGLDRFNDSKAIGLNYREVDFLLYKVEKSLPPDLSFFEFSFSTFFSCGTVRVSRGPVLLPSYHH